jgi:HAD superfamily hydrolase (TIGR01484 family)
LSEKGSIAQMKIQAFFSDYDGTLCPLEVRRQEAVISQRLRRFLTTMSKRITVGIVTTKDLDFIRERMPFVHGISAVAGLQMQVGEKIFVDERAVRSTKKMETACHQAVSKIIEMGEDILVERKSTEDDELIAFCIDWRMSKDWEGARKKVKPILAQCKEVGLYVVESEHSPFANVYPFEVDKGSALTKLRNELHAAGPIMYMGDSEADNPAFQISDVSVGVKHLKVMPQLSCRYQVEFFELEAFILRLLDSDFEFSAEMAQPNPRYKG